MAAAVIPAIDQDIADAGCAHVAEGDLLRIGQHGFTVPQDISNSNSALQQR